VNWWPPGLKDEAEMEGYIYFDKHIRALPKKPDGTVDTLQPGFHNNDVDAFRHAYVSGVFTHEYGEKIARFLGWLNEFANIAPESRDENNMDCWNNEVGRKLALKYKTREQLADAIKNALANGELITAPSDERVYEGVMVPRPTGHHSVIVLKESSTGANELFFDMKEDRTMTRAEFVEDIDSGKYPGYTTRTIGGVVYPVSKRDLINANNLG
jgi:hypothetical protein